MHCVALLQLSAVSLLPAAWMLVCCCLPGVYLPFPVTALLPFSVLWHFAYFNTIAIVLVSYCFPFSRVVLLLLSADWLLIPVILCCVLLLSLLFVLFFPYTVIAATLQYFWRIPAASCSIPSGFLLLSCCSVPLNCLLLLCLVALCSSLAARCCFLLCLSAFLVRSCCLQHCFFLLLAVLLYFSWIASASSCKSADFLQITCCLFWLFVASDWLVC